MSMLGATTSAEVDVLSERRVRPLKPGGEVGNRAQKNGCGLGEGDQRGTKPQPEAACVDRRIERFSFLVRERRDSESCR